MKSHAHQPGHAFRVQVIDTAHGQPVYAVGADTQKSAIVQAEAMRADPAHAGREIEIVRQTRPRFNDPTRWRRNNETGAWEAVARAVADDLPRRREARGHAFP